MIGGGLVALQKNQSDSLPPQQTGLSRTSSAAITLSVAGVSSVSISVLQLREYLLLQMSARCFFNRTPLPPVPSPPGVLAVFVAPWHAEGA